MKRVFLTRAGEVPILVCAFQSENISRRRAQSADDLDGWGSAVAVFCTGVRSPFLDQDRKLQHRRKKRGSASPFRRGVGARRRKLYARRSSTRAAPVALERPRTSILLTTHVLPCHRRLDTALFFGTDMLAAVEAL